MARPTWRRFTAEYKLRVLQAAERCGPGELGGLLRREGLYASHLTTWRKQRETGALAALAAQKRGPTSSTCPRSRAFHQAGHQDKAVQLSNAIRNVAGPI